MGDSWRRSWLNRVGTTQQVTLPVPGGIGMATNGLVIRCSNHHQTPVSAPPPPHGGYTYGGGPVVAPVRFSAALKTVAIVVSVLKAIPLVLALIAAIFLAAASRSIDDDFGELGFGLDGLVGAAIAVIVFFVAIGALLVGFQFVGALKERPLMVFIPALIMSLIDVLLAIGSWSAWNQARNSVFENESPGGAFMMTAVAAAQIYYRGASHSCQRSHEAEATAQQVADRAECQLIDVVLRQPTSHRDGPDCIDSRHQEVGVNAAAGTVAA